MIPSGRTPGTTAGYGRPAGAPLDLPQGPSREIDHDNVKDDKVLCLNTVLLYVQEVVTNFL